MLLRPRPVQEQDRLIFSWREAPTAGSAFYPFGDVEIEAVARDSQLLESAAGVTRNGVRRAVVSDGMASSYANVGLVTGGFFEVLGAQAALGRRFTLTEDRDGAEPAAVISHGYWQRHFGGAPDAAEGCGQPCAGLTSVPIFSPRTARTMLPCPMRSKTTMGRVLSMQRLMAVASMTFRPRCRTSP